MDKKCPQCGAPLTSGALEGLCPACLLKQGATDTSTGSGPEPAQFQPPTVEELAKLFPQLDIISFIGKGGMGAVYKARQPSLDRVVALKILPSHALTGPGFTERFHREARALARLNHPNIVAVHDFGEVGNLPFFIMEFVDGPNLRQLERAGKLSPRQALQIVPQICEALQFAHDEGIVHRDIKPENILLDKKGRVKIADFGIAKIVGQAPGLSPETVAAAPQQGPATVPMPPVTEQGSILGTPQYMAPEQVEKPQSVDHRADIFSLGVVFYEMLTGELPLGRFPPPSRKVEVDVRLDDVVLRTLEKEPERRYQQASQVKTAVETISTGAGPSPSRPVPQAPNAEALADEILARDYDLDVRSCIRRGWALVRSDFWPLVGINALFMALLSATSSGSAATWHGNTTLPQGSSILFLVLQGPLVGGLYLYFLRKIRGQPVSIELAFSGFSSRFLHLFLGSFVTMMLTGVGFFCLIIPGIYLFIAWLFTLPLIMDRGLDFWPAMELSRKVITRHWWKFLGLAIVLGALCFAGLIACVVGLFVAAPVALSALMYAYEDIFSFNQAAPAVPPATAPAESTPSPAGTSGPVSWRPTKLGLAVGVIAVVLIAAIAITNIMKVRHQRLWRVRQLAYSAPQVARVSEAASSSEQSENTGELTFGPVVERTLEIADPNHRALHLAPGTFLAPAPNHDSDFFGTNGVNALRTAGTDLFLSDNALAPDNITALDMRMLSAFFPDEADTNVIALERITSDQFQQIVLKTWQVPDSTGDADYAAIVGMVKARAARNHEDIIRGTNIYTFATRDGAEGLLQIVSSTDDPRSVRIQYRLLQQPAGSQVAGEKVGPRRISDRADFSERLKAAGMINNNDDRDRALAALALDAAHSGQTDFARQALNQMINMDVRDDSMRKAALALAKHGKRKQAIELVSGIVNLNVRDQTLMELAK